MLTTARLIVMILVLLVVSPALADNWNDCASTNPDRVIKGCSAIIHDSGATRENRVFGYYKRGDVYDRQGQYEKALADYRKAIAAYPSTGNLHSKLKERISQIKQKLLVANIPNSTVGTPVPLGSIPRPRPKPIEVLMMAAANKVVEPAMPPLTQESSLAQESNSAAKGTFADALRDGTAKGSPLMQPMLNSLDGSDINWWPEQLAYTPAQTVRQNGGPPQEFTTTEVSLMSDTQVSNAKSDWDLCRGALNVQRLKWDLGPEWLLYVNEAKRRSFGVNTCQSILAINQDVASQVRAAPIKVAADGSGYFVRLSSSRSEAEANAEYSRLKSKYASIIGNLPSAINPTTVGGSTRYRLAVGPLSSREQATKICSSLVAAGERDCLVVLGNYQKQIVAQQNIKVIPERDLSGNNNYPEISADELPYGDGKTVVLDAETEASESSSSNITIIPKIPPAEPTDETFKIAKGRTLIDELTNRGVTKEAAQALAAAIEPVFPARMIKDGTEFDLTLDRQQDFYGRDATFPVQLSFKPGPQETITIEADEDGQFVARVDGKEKGTASQYAQITQFRTKARVGSSLYAAAKDNRVPEYIIAELTRVFSFDVDFQRQVKPNDTFEVFYGNPLTGSSTKRKVLHYAQLTLGGVTKTYYRYVNADGEVSYMDENGRSAGRHLQYQDPVTGKQLAPNKVTASSGKQLAGTELQKYKLYKQRVLAMMQYAPSATQVAQANQVNDAESSPIKLGNERDWIYCISGDPDLTIEGCSSIIEVGSDTKERLAIAFRSRGIAYGKKSNLELAIKDYDQAIAYDPKDAIAYDYRGAAYSYNLEFGRAFGDYNRAIALNPNYANAYYNRGIAYDSTGNIDRAIADFDRVIALNPKFGGAYYSRANEFEKKGEWDRAADDWRTAIARIPASDVLQVELRTRLATAETMIAPREPVEPSPEPNFTTSEFGARIALVIGNSAYQYIPRLDNPDNDAELMATTLEKVGFKVTKLINADQRTMKQAMQEFERELRSGADASVFYYSGHGVQDNGENFLIPVDASIKDMDEVDAQSVGVNAFMKTTRDSASKVKIVVLDACRNNPFSASSKSVSSGLASVIAPSGTLIAYSTAPGSVAEDGDGKNSPYTAALAEQILQPGLKIEEAFKQTRIQVMNASGQKQVPWETTSLTGDFYFVPTQ